MDPTLQAVVDAKRALEADPGDGLAQSRARGVLAEARERWPALDLAERDELAGPATALRHALESAPLVEMPDQALDAGMPDFDPAELFAGMAAGPVDPPTVGPPPEPEELLARLGLVAFRPGQREAVAAALAGRDSLVVMPTGGASRSATSSRRSPVAAWSSWSAR